jgi:hypothetical protein
VKKAGQFPLAQPSAGDLAVGAIAAGVALLLYRQTLAPSVVALFDDSLEFPLVADRLAIPHPTGYPLYALLLKLFSLLPLGELAWRVNLLSAVAGALAVGTLALVILLLAGTPSRWGDRLGALVGALALAVSPVFWSQAVVAEVYTLAALISVLAVLTLLRALASGHWRWFALVVGVGLAHHRTFLLLLPALGLATLTFGALPSPRGWNWRWLARQGWPLLIGPLLYLYLPLRAGVGSIDGTYRNDLPTFLGWVSGALYRGFLQENPLARAGDPLTSYLHLVVEQVSPAGVLLAAGGLAWLAWRRWPLAVLLLAWYFPAALFAVLYRVPDPEVFALPSFLPIIVALGLGVVAVGRLLAWAVQAIPRWGRLPARLVSALALLAFLALPLRTFALTYERVDLSTETTVRAYGVDILSQPLPASSAIIGLLGEASLLHYLQRALGLRPDIAVRHADGEAERLALVEAALAEGREVYLTRPLAGLAERYALNGLGPLVAVERTPPLVLPPGVRPVNRSFGALELLGYQSELIRGYALGPGGPHDLRAVARGVRVALYWRATQVPTEDLLTFVHFSEPAGERWAQSDSVPVRGAYPVTRWRPGTIVADVHDVPLPLGTPPGDYVLTAGIVRQNGEPLGGGANEREVRLGIQPLPPQLGGYTPRRLDLDPAFARFGAVTLIGQRVPTGVVQPGALITVETLWRAERELAESLTLTAELVQGERTVPLGGTPLGGRYTTIRWRAGELVRDRESFRLPADLPDGRYSLRISLGPGLRQTLGTLTIEGRQRLFQLPTPPANRTNVRLQGGADLLGWTARAISNASEPQVEITLYWRALGTLDRDYHVFVHLVAMNRVVAQHDGPPAEGTAPTPSWVANEIIVDRHLVPLPVGIAPHQLWVTVGMYDPATGRRLQTSRGDSIELGALRLEP